MISFLLICPQGFEKGCGEAKSDSSELPTVYSANVVVNAHDGEVLPLYLDNIHLGTSACMRKC